MLIEALGLEPARQGWLRSKGFAPPVGIVRGTDIRNVAISVDTIEGISGLANVHRQNGFERQGELNLRRQFFQWCYMLFALTTCVTPHDFAQVSIQARESVRTTV